MILPLMFAVFCSFSLKIYSGDSTGITRPDKKLTVIIDAGHGGTDNGAVNDHGDIEKEITLSIAKKVKDLALRHNVDVILTRDKDELPGGAASVNEGLRKRLEKAGDAGMFISIHVASDPADKRRSGFEVYVSKSNPVYEKSVMLGSMMTETLQRTWKTERQLKQRENIFVLKQSPVPAIILEAGYLSNEKDMAFIKNPQNQEKVAADILQAAIKYSALSK